MIETKICTKCKETKKVDLFYKRSDHLGKYTAHCKACKRSHDNAHALKSEIKAQRVIYGKERRSDPVARKKDQTTKAAYHRTEEYRTKKKEEIRLRRLDPAILAKERIRGAIYAKEHPEKFAMKTRKRKVAKLQRTPFWLNAGELFELECVYRYCAALRSIGFDYEVDHIIPLQGKTVSGFHVPWNLQVLTASENATKGNRP